MIRLKDDFSVVVVTWPVAYFILYLFRVALSVAGEVVVRRFTTLGDAHRYQSKSRSIGSSLENGSTSLTEAIGTIFSEVSNGNVIVINLGFMTLGYIGIIAFLASLPGRYRLFALLFVMLPSFNLWTSVASKEAIILFSIGIISACISQIFLGYQRVRWWYLAAVPLLAFYKPHYMPAILYLLAAITVAPYLRQPATLMFLGGLASVVLLFVFHDTLDFYALQVAHHFISGGSGLSTREPFWMDQYDVLYKAPYGMWLGFFGPTLSEAQSGHLLHAFSFMESMLVVILLAYLIFTSLPDRPAFSFVVLFFALFWMLFANYPLGVMNPGTAVRYRTGYYLFIVAVVILMSSRHGFERWRDRPRRIALKFRPLWV